MPNLEILDISNNKIKSLPRDFGTCMGLKALRISKNLTKKLPTYMCDMENLVHLELDGNPLQFPPKNITMMPKGWSNKTHMRPWLANLKDYLRDQRQIDQAGIEFETSGSSEEDVPDYECKTLKKATSTDSLIHCISSRQTGEGSGALLNTINENEQLNSKHERKRQVPQLNLEFRNYSNDSFDPTSGHRYPFPRQHLKSFSQDSVESFSSQNGSDLERSADVYFQRLRSSPSTDHLQTNDIALREASRNILYGLSQVYKGVRQFTAFTGNERLFTNDLKSAGKFMEQLVDVLEQFDNDSLTQRPDGKTCSKLLKTCSLNITEFRSLITFLHNQLRTLTRSQDYLRYSRTLLLMLHGATAEIKFAWESISPLLNSDYTPYTGTSTPFRTRSMSRLNSNGAPHSAGIVPSNGPLSSTFSSSPLTTTGMPHGVLITEALLKKVETAISSVEHVLQLLAEIVEQAQASFASGDDHSQPALVVRNMIKDLALHVKDSKDVTKQLKKTAQTAQAPSSPKDEVALQVKFYGDTLAFLQTTVKMVSLVKEVSQEYPIKQEVRLGLGQVTKSHIDLTNLLRRQDQPSVNSPSFGESVQQTPTTANAPQRVSDGEVVDGRNGNGVFKNMVDDSGSLENRKDKEEVDESSVGAC